MRPSNKSRSRNKSGNNNNNNQNRRSVGNIINRVFESAGPEGKVRGTPQQIIEKYVALARDAQVANDRVAAESFQQHAEHYSRMLGEAQRQQMEQRGGNDRDDNQRDDLRGDDQRDYGQRDDNSRGDTQRDDNQRGDNQRDYGQRGEDQRGGNQRDYNQREGNQRGEDQPQVPRQQPVLQDSGSGLTTFDVADGDDLSGPVETPEGARAQTGAEAPRPALAPRYDRRPEPQQRGPEPRQADVEQGNGAPPAMEASDDAPAAPAKRPRTRRKARPEIDTAEAQAK